MNQRARYYLAERRYGEMLQDFLWMQTESGNPLTVEDARAMVRRNPRWQWMLDWFLAREGGGRHDSPCAHGHVL